MILLQKLRQAVLQQRQDWVAPQIKDLKLVIPEHYTFMASNSFFIALSILDNYLAKTTRDKSTLSPGTIKSCLGTLPFPKLLSLYCKQINMVKNDVDGVWFLRTQNLWISGHTGYVCKTRYVQWDFY